MDTWVIIVGAVGFTVLVMLLGPWMWSSTWTTWTWGRKPKGGPQGPPRDEPGPKPPAP